MFSEDMFDACLVELNQLISGLDTTRIHKLWLVHSIDKKSEHFVVLYDDTGHLCTCLTLINRGLICHHFFTVMLVSPNAKFHIGLMPQRWYQDSFALGANFSAEPAISAISCKKFGAVEYNTTEVDFSHLKEIRGNHVFTAKVHEEMVRK